MLSAAVFDELERAFGREEPTQPSAKTIPPATIEDDVATVHSIEESRQVRRAKARGMAKMKESVERIAGREEAILATSDARIARLMRAQHALLALVKREGRIRMSKRELASITTGDALEFKVQDNGDVVVSFHGG